MTGQPVGINLLAETIPGALLPNRPIANMVLKCYSVQTMQVALAFTQDLKLGHYMKVPPRATFMGSSKASFRTNSQFLTALIPDSTRRCYGHCRRRSSRCQTMAVLDGLGYLQPETG